MDTLQGNPFPVGSIESLRAAGLDPAVYPSCSAPQGYGRCMGCGSHPTCIFPFKDKGAGTSRPQNVAVARVYRVNNSAITRIKPCYHYMQHDHPRRSSDPNTAYAVSVIGYEGDEVKIQITEKLHEKAETNCEACREGRCMARVSKIQTLRVPEWKPPTEQFTQSEFAAQVTQQMRERVEREAMGALVGAKLPLEGPTVTEPKPKE